MLTTALTQLAAVLNPTYGKRSSYYCSYRVEVFVCLFPKSTARESRRDGPVQSGESFPQHWSRHALCIGHAADTGTPVA